MNQERTRIELYDTTLRDGAQAQGISFSLKDKLEIAEAIDSLGVDYIEGGFPQSNPKDEQFFREVTRKNFRKARIVAFGMTRRKDVKSEDDPGMQALLGSSAPVITIVGKTWDLHVSDVLRATTDENLAMIDDSVAMMVKAGREVIYDAEHFFDGYKANPEYAMKTLRAAHDAGASCLVLCDTNGGSTLAEVAELTRKTAEAFPGAKIGIHNHNDCGLAVANSLMAVRHGATHVQGTINGIGERCGNADLIAIAGNLALKYHSDVLLPDALEHLTETSRLVYELANLNYRENQPFVGSSAFAHKGGMHVHAVQRNSKTYEHIDPSIVGNRRRVLISELSGTSGILAAVSPKFALDDDKDAQRAILRQIVEKENTGYEFESAEASLEMLVRKTLGGKWYRKLWDMDHYRCVILKRDGEDANTEATVKLTIDGQIKHKVAEGDGPVDSLMSSLKATLRGRFPHVDDLHLMDYRVRVVNTAAETAARVRVAIDWRDATSETHFGSVGVDENIIDASWLALVDAIEYKLLNKADK